jgi:hypothetical protein
MSSVAVADMTHDSEVGGVIAPRSVVVGAG